MTVEQRPLKTWRNNKISPSGIGSAMREMLKTRCSCVPKSSTWVISRLLSLGAMLRWLQLYLDVSCASVVLEASGIISNSTHVWKLKHSWITYGDGSVALYTQDVGASTTSGLLSPSHNRLSGCFWTSRAVAAKFSNVTHNARPRSTSSNNRTTFFQGHYWN